MKHVSLVIPCRNEAAYIGRCLDSIIACNYPKDHLQVYVCDGQSDDGTVAIIQRYEKEHPWIHYLENKARTTPIALNLGIKTSSADIDIILGAHSEIDVDFVKNNVAAHESDPAAGCTGGIAINVFENETSKAVGAAMSSSFGVGNAYFRTGGKEGYVDTVGCGAYRKEVFHKVGYFDEELTRNQDDEFNYRVNKGGYKVLLKKNIILRYYVRASFKKLFRQYYQYGYWKVYVNRKHTTITTLRQLVPAFFVLFLLSAAALPFLPGIITYAYLGVLALYLVAGGTAAARSGASFFKVLFSFIVLHISYGAGYLEGIAAFLLFRKGPKRSSTSSSR
jgi:GT2 family glycosyltransferase